MSALDPGLRRVSVHAGATAIDLSLPAGVPVATLIPSIVEMLDGHCGDGLGAATSFRLSSPGGSPLPTSTTLAQSGIRDGAVLVLSQPATPLPVPRYDDPADAIASAIGATALPWNRRATQLAGAVAAGLVATIGGLALIRTASGTSATRNLSTVTVMALAAVAALLGAAMAQRSYRNAGAAVTLSLVSAGFATVAGFLAVPGTPGGPNLLLAAMAAAVTSVLATRVTACGVVTLTAVACFALFLAAAALVAVLTAAPPRSVGSVCALISLGLLGLASRASIVFSGLSPHLPPALDPDAAELSGDFPVAKVIRADDWLTSLLSGFASSAAVGAIVTVLSGGSRVDGVAFAAITSALLLLRARYDRRRTIVFATTGILSAGATFAIAAISTPERGPWLGGVTATLVAAAIYLGFVAPAISVSPTLRRSVELLECVALVALVPLTCWICGLYGAVRGLSPN